MSILVVIGSNEQKYLGRKNREGRKNLLTMLFTPRLQSKVIPFTSKLWLLHSRSAVLIGVNSNANIGEDYDFWIADTQSLCDLDQCTALSKEEICNLGIWQNTWGMNKYSIYKTNIDTNVDSHTGTYCLFPVLYSSLNKLEHFRHLLSARLLMATVEW